MDKDSDHKEIGVGGDLLTVAKDKLKLEKSRCSLIHLAVVVEAVTELSINLPI